MTERETYAPHIEQPDDPADGLMTAEQSKAAAKKVAELHPELVDHSLDGPIT